MSTRYPRFDGTQPCLGASPEAILDAITSADSERAWALIRDFHDQHPEQCRAWGNAILTAESMAALVANRP